MKKYVVTILAAFTVCTSFFALPTLTETGAKAFAENTDQLITPTSYEQYLELEKPSGITVSERYTAIADGNVIYVYDGVENIYKEYTHAGNHGVTKMQFSDMGVLYFSDESTHIYGLDPRTATLIDVQADFVCSTFVIDGNDIYYSNVSDGVSSISKTTLDKMERTEPFLRNIMGNTVFTVSGDSLLFTDSRKYLRKIDKTETAEGNGYLICDFPDAIESLTVCGSFFFCTDEEGTFRAYHTAELYPNNSNLSPIFVKDGNFSKMAGYSNYVYTIEGASVKQYSIKDQTFTSFEICSTSSSPYRLNGGTDLLLYEDKILVADSKNLRLTVRDKKGDYSTIPTNKQTSDMSSALLAATDNTALLVLENAAHLYDLTTGAYLQSFGFGENKLKGAVGVYGKYYFVTATGGYYVAEKQRVETETEQKEEWILQDPKFKQGSTPTMLTADVYGNLYVARANDVYRYTEEEFLQPTAEGELVATIPTNTKKISLGFGLNLYALTDNTLVRFQKGETDYSELSVRSNCVYQSENATAISFTVSVLENQTYLLYDGNYIVATQKAQLPTVKTVTAENADQTIFNNESAVFSVVRTKEKSLMIEFSLEELVNADYFPYVNHFREEGQKIALKIGETSEYSILAEYDHNKRVYHTYAVLSSSCETFDESEYLTRFESEGEQIRYGYLTNSVNVYKFPYLTSLLTLDKLPKNAKIQLLGEVTKLDNDYYHVAYQTENGEQKMGYVPKSYVTDFDGSTPDKQSGEVTGNPANTDHVWRLAFILCGFAVIGILVDCLILRKRQ